jgi:tripartite motif-containing protein 37
MNEITNMIENLSHKKSNKEEVCSEHNVTLLYFCNTCNESLCSDCYMFGNKHKEHDIQKLENIYVTHIDRIKTESKELTGKYDQLNNILKSLNEKIIFVRNYKLERSNELEELFDSLRYKLENVMQGKLNKLTASKNTITDKIKYLERIKTSIDLELAESPKSLLIAKSDQLITNLKNLSIGNDLNADDLNVSIDVPSDIYPPYETSVFEIKEYKKYIGSNSVLKNAILYSPDLITNGLKWRLKVYPNGNGANAVGEYISIFLELVEGLYETSKYFYKIELCMPDKQNNSGNYTREFTSDFQNGECWGYNKFYRIEAIEREGYIDKNGSVLIKFFVRPQTYTQLCRDQKNYIQNLEKRLLLANKVDANSNNNLRTSEEITMNNFNMINNLNNNIDPVNNEAVDKIINNIVGGSIANDQPRDIIQEEVKESNLVSSTEKKQEIVKEPQDVEEVGFPYFESNLEVNNNAQRNLLVNNNPRLENNHEVIHEEEKLPDKLDLGLIKMPNHISREQANDNLIKLQNALINPTSGKFFINI